MLFGFHYKDCEKVTKNLSINIKFKYLDTHLSRVPHITTTKITTRHTTLKPFQYFLWCSIEADISKLLIIIKGWDLSEIAHINKNWIQTFNIPWSYTLLYLLSIPNVFHFASTPTLQSQADLLLLKYVRQNILKLISWTDKNTQIQNKGCGCAGFGWWSS